MSSADDTTVVESVVDRFARTTLTRALSLMLLAVFTRAIRRKGPFGNAVESNDRSQRFSRDCSADPIEDAILEAGFTKKYSTPEAPEITPFTRDIPENVISDGRSEKAKFEAVAEVPLEDALVEADGAYVHDLESSGVPAQT